MPKGKAGGKTKAKTVSRSIKEKKRDVKKLEEELWKEVEATVKHPSGVTGAKCRFFIQLGADPKRDVVAKLKKRYPFSTKILKVVTKANKTWYKLVYGCFSRVEDAKTSLEDLKAAIEQSWTLMKKLRVVEGCGTCATVKPGGGCCGAGIENWYDPYVLLMNLMLGREIPDQRPDKTSCLFLGPTGCRLIARFHFCIDYLCHDIKERLSQTDMEKLCAQNGREIYMGWQLENILRERLHAWQ
jgi:hypothetical protein